MDVLYSAWEEMAAQNGSKYVSTVINTSKSLKKNIGLHHKIVLIIFNLAVVISSSCMPIG